MIHTRTIIGSSQTNTLKKWQWKFKKRRIKTQKKISNYIDRYSNGRTNVKTDTTNKPPDKQVERQTMKVKHIHCHIAKYPMFPCLPRVDVNNGVYFPHRPLSQWNVIGGLEEASAMTFCTLPDASFPASLSRSDNAEKEKFLFAFL